MVSARLSPPAITVDQLVKRFQIARQRSEGSRIRWRPTRYDTLEVLRGVTFAVEPGELFGLMGRNGSGKSTLLKIISGVYPADSGTVRIEGRLAPALQLGVGFSPELSAGENAAITAVMLGLSRRDARLQVDSILDFADLRDFSETRLKDLSHGMRMRLAFAALIETDPDLLLVDEILAVGDRAFQEKCTEAFADFRRRGRTIVLVSHATGLIERLCDRALLLEQRQGRGARRSARGGGSLHRGQRPRGRKRSRDARRRGRAPWRGPDHRGVAGGHRRARADTRRG